MNRPKLSYLVTCKDETDSLEKLLLKLIVNIGENDSLDEIIILKDGDSTMLLPESPTDEIINKIIRAFDFVKLVVSPLSGNFGKHKTYGSRKCAGQFILQIDADEYPHEELLNILPQILNENPSVDLYRLPRVNIVHGATLNDGATWGWHMAKLPEFGDAPIINWNSGDYQARLYRNSEKIYWHKALHETITGHESAAALPKEVECAIIHEKTIVRQTAQNEFYNKNWSTAANMGNG